jgi:hypothetical protein
MSTFSLKEVQQVLFWQHFFSSSSSYSFIITLALYHVSLTLQKTNPPSFSHCREKLKGFFFCNTSLSSH